MTRSLTNSTSVLKLSNCLLCAVFILIARETVATSFQDHMVYDESLRCARIVRCRSEDMRYRRRLPTDAQQKVKMVVKRMSDPLLDLTVKLQRNDDAIRKTLYQPRTGDTITIKGEGLTHSAVRLIAGKFDHVGVVAANPDFSPCPTCNPKRLSKKDYLRHEIPASCEGSSENPCGKCKGECQVCDETGNTKKDSERPKPCIDGDKCETCHGTGTFYHTTKNACTDAKCKWVHTGFMEQPENRHTIYDEKYVVMHATYTGVILSRINSSLFGLERCRQFYLHRLLVKKEGEELFQREELDNKSKDFVKRWKGSEYARILDFAKSLWVVQSIFGCKPGEDAKGKRSFFCSQLVAFFLQEMGIVELGKCSKGNEEHTSEKKCTDAKCEACAGTGNTEKDPTKPKPCVDWGLGGYLVSAPNPVCSKCISCNGTGKCEWVHYTDNHYTPENFENTGEKGSEIAMVGNYRYSDTPIDLNFH